MRTFKRIITTLLLVSMIIGSVPAMAASKTYVGVNIDGNPVTFDATTRPFILPDAGRAVIPLRKVAELMGAGVIWNDAERSVTFTKGSNAAKLIIGQKQYTLNGEHKAMDIAAFIENSRTYVPFRVIGESLGATVGYDDPTKTVLISTADKTSGNEVFNQIRAAFPANQTIITGTQGSLFIKTSGQPGLYSYDVVLDPDGFIGIKAVTNESLSALSKVLPYYYPTQYQQALDAIKSLKKENDITPELTLDGKPFSAQHFGTQIDIHTTAWKTLQ